MKIYMKKGFEIFPFLTCYIYIYIIYIYILQLWSLIYTFILSRDFLHGLSLGCWLRSHVSQPPRCWLLWCMCLGASPQYTWHIPCSISRSKTEWQTKNDLCACVIVLKRWKPKITKPCVELISYVISGIISIHFHTFNQYLHTLKLNLL